MGVESGGLNKGVGGREGEAGRRGSGVRVDRSSEDGVFEAGYIGAGSRRGSDAGGRRNFRVVKRKSGPEGRGLGCGGRGGPRREESMGGGESLG